VITRRALVLTLALVVVGHGSVNSQHVNLRLNGLDIGIKYDSIAKKLGKPISDRRLGNVPCGDAMRTLRYDGLQLNLEAGGDNPFGLYRVEVTKPRWSVSGIRIGSRRSDVVRKFGRGTAMTDDGQDYLDYDINDGFARFSFRKNRLRKVEWEFNFC
jgi:hypothetical protein